MRIGVGIAAMVAVAALGCKDKEKRPGPTRVSVQSPADARPTPVATADARPSPQNAIATDAAVPSAPMVRDVTKTMAARPRLELNLTENLILSDYGGKALATLRLNSARLNACLEQLSKAEEVKPPTSLDFMIDPKGRAFRIRFYGARRAEACFVRRLRAIRFPKGSERMALVKVKSFGPPGLLKDPAITTLTWTVNRGGFEIKMKAAREGAGPSYLVRLSTTMKARRGRRGVGHSLRFNSKLHLRGGGSENSFSLQDSTPVTRCLKRGESQSFERLVSKPVHRGERLELSVYVLGGSCKDGKGRWEVGMVILDWRSNGPIPTLYVAPSWRG